MLYKAVLGLESGTLYLCHRLRRQRLQSLLATVQIFSVRQTLINNLTFLSSSSTSIRLSVLLFLTFLASFSIGSGFCKSPWMWLSGKYPLGPNSFSQMISSPSNRAIVSKTGKAPPHRSMVTFSSPLRGSRLSGW